jgi:cyclopropane fatty-acyl-phospholipid synthase-like methyltransferase
MVISYHGEPPQVADRLLVVGGTMSKALRNRLRLGSAILAHLIDTSEANPVHVLCLGAGPGQIITTAMAQAERPAIATLVDLNSDAFEYGRERAESLGLGERVKFIQGDIREIEPLLEHAPDIVKMLGICEYLTDEQIIEIASAAARVMPAGASIVFNSLSRAHGNDRFFRRVFGLNMIYRTPEELTELMRRSGFEDFQTYPEPLGVYHVIVGHRREPAGEQEGR